MSITVINSWPAVQNSGSNNFAATTTKDVTGATTNIAVVSWKGDTNSVTQVIDTEGNTYTSVMSFNTGDNIGIYVANNITTSTAQFLTVEMSANTQCAITAISFSGLSASAPFDKGAFTDTNVSTSFTSGNSGNIRDANSVLIGAATWYSADATITPGSGYTTIGFGATSGGTKSAIYMEYQIVTGASGAKSATATASLSTDYTMAIAIFGDGGGGGGATNSIVPHTPPPIYIFS